MPPESASSLDIALSGALAGAAIGLVIAIVVLFVGENDLTVMLNFPAFFVAFIVTVLLGGSVHTPSAAAFFLCIIGQWAVVGALANVVFKRVARRAQRRDISNRREA